MGDDKARYVLLTGRCGVITTYQWDIFLILSVLSPECYTHTIYNWWRTVWIRLGDTAYKSQSFGYRFSHQPARPYNN